MGFLGDAVDWVSDRADDVKGAAGSIASAVPGAEWLGGQVTDFLNTETGRIVARALSTTLYGALAPVVGPQLAAAAFATPGLIRGDRFSKAWIEEFQIRVEMLAQILGDEAAKELSGLIGPTLDKLKGDFPQLNDLGNVPSDIIPTLPDIQTILNTPVWKIALPRNLREDLTALAISALTKVPIDISNYDIETGKDLSVTDEQRVKVLYPYASTLVNDKMQSNVSYLLRNNKVADQMQSKVSMFASNQKIPASAVVPPVASITPVPAPPLVAPSNPLLRESSASPGGASAQPWYTTTWAKLAGAAGLATVAYVVWRKNQ